jgi:hypothetical protein
VLESIGGPLLWGLIATFVYYFVIHQRWVSHPLLVRYTAGHPVEYFETAFFFVGLMAVVRRGRLGLAQLMQTESVALLPADDAPLAAQVSGLLGQLAGWSNAVRQSCYGRRLHDALSYLQRRDAADGLADELKYLNDVEAERTHDGYSLVRIIIWAIPMLGFLGTVIGITEALAELSPESLVNSPKDAMEGLLGGLGVAFDTTALALSQSIVLMLMQFMTHQIESHLATVVDQRVTADLAGFLRSAHATTADPQVTTLRQLAQAMVDSVELNSRRQAAVWQQVLEQSHQQWSALIETAAHAVETALAGAVQQSLETHCTNLARVEAEAARSAQGNWRQWHELSADMLAQLGTQQSELRRHGEILQQALQATGQVMTLEQALNQNLRALAGAKNFEDTVMSLSAAIHLLNSRLGRPQSRDAQVKLEAQPQERAA